MKIVFMGTPDFAVPSLHALTEAGYAVAAVVTQPDKPKGRGKTLLPTPVKEEAVMHDFRNYCLPDFPSAADYFSNEILKKSAIIN